MPDLPMSEIADDSDIPDVEVVVAEQPKPPRDPGTWTPISAALEEQLPSFTFHIWIEPLELVVRRGPELVVAAPPYIRTSVKERYSKLIARVATDLFGSAMYVTVVSQEWFPAS